MNAHVRLNEAQSLLREQLDEHITLFQTLGSLADPMEQAATLVAEALKASHKLLLCGNGGSAADSQHLAAEFTGRFLKDRRPLAAMALSTDSSALTCIANDYSFEEVFSRQVLGLGRAGDCLLAISTSGNSPNVLRAVGAAKSIGMKVIGLSGRDGGKLHPLCEVSLVIPHTVTARIQEAHIFFGHMLCSLVEAQLGFA